MTPRRPILIAGAGIAGLTSALCLARFADVRVVEAAADIREVGAGIQLSPNASRILAALGLRQEIESAAARPKMLRIFNANSGKEITSMPLGQSIEDRYGAPYWVIHRGQLQAILVAAARRHPRIELLCDCAVTGVHQNPEALTVTIDQAGHRQNLPAGILIGADGVWSTVRQSIGNLTPASYSGKSAWRATIPISQAPTGISDWTGLWLSRDAHLVHYPISGGQSLNIVAIIEDAWREKGWSAPGDRRLLMDRFVDWDPKARNLLLQPDRWLKWALCGVDPSQKWVDGRVALIGDAAHAMLPFLAQGGAMAIEDAAVLEDRLFGHLDDPTPALLAYQADRRPRVNRVVTQAYNNGRIYHLGGPAARLRDIALRAIGGTAMQRRYDWLYGWKPGSIIH